MSLRLKRNMPLLLSLLAVVLVLVIFLGNLRVGATNVHLGTWTELRVAVAVEPTSADAASPQLSIPADQPVYFLEQYPDAENAN